MSEPSPKKAELADIIDTKNYLQDTAKVISQFQQIFLPPEPHFWHVGLEYSVGSITSQLIEIDDRRFRCVLDLRAGTVSLDSKIWKLAEYSAVQLLAALQEWLKGNGIKKDIDTPALSSGNANFDIDESNLLAEMFNFANDTLVVEKRSITTGQTSPVLLYPHHFDLAFSWFKPDDLQLTTGFSTGDENIREPYFYVTAYPEPKDFKDIRLPEPAYWQKSGFSGAILNYNDLASVVDASGVVRDYLETVLHAS